jgi:hypothetical protein
MSSRTATVVNRCSGLSALPRCLLLGGLAGVASWALGAPPAHAQASTAQITVLYDAFGKTSTMRKDWGVFRIYRIWRQAHFVRYRQ